MATAPADPLPLTAPQKEALIELGSRGAGGAFDQLALGQLFVLGLVEVRNADRRLALTERGQLRFQALMSGEQTAQ